MYHEDFKLLAGLESSIMVDIGMIPLKFVKIEGNGRFIVVFERSNTSKIFSVNSMREING
jgi:hypothetical protein